MASYRVIIQVECDEENIRQQLGQDFLEQLHKDSSGEDYLVLYIEREFGWIKQSFNRVEISDITSIESLKEN